MKAVFFIEKDKYSEAKNKAYSDEEVSRQTIIIRDNASLGLEKEGYYLLINGDDKAVGKAKKLLAESAKELSGEDAEKAISAIDNQESSAAEGFGAIFG